MDIYQPADLSENDVNNIVEHLEHGTTSFAIQKLKMERALYNCDKCNQSFELLEHLCEHEGRQHKENDLKQKHICAQCCRWFSDYSAFEEHKKIHEPVLGRPYKCDVCSRGYVSKLQLNCHKKVHSTEFICKFCDKYFTEMSDLIAHMKFHKSGKPYKCEYCYKEFSKKTDLYRHKRIHTGDKPYACDKCGKLFTLAAGVRSHKATHHTQKSSEDRGYKGSTFSPDTSQDYRCNVCNVKFESLDKLRKHSQDSVHMKTTNDIGFDCATSSVLLENLPF